MSVIRDRRLTGSPRRLLNANDYSLLIRRGTSASASKTVFLYAIASCDTLISQPPAQSRRALGKHRVTGFCDLVWFAHHRKSRLPLAKTANQSHAQLNSSRTGHVNSERALSRSSRFRSSTSRARSNVSVGVISLKHTQP